MGEDLGISVSTTDVGHGGLSDRKALVVGDALETVNREGLERIERSFDGRVERLDQVAIWRDDPDMVHFRPGLTDRPGEDPDRFRKESGPAEEDQVSG